MTPMNMTPRERVMRAIEHRMDGGRIPFTLSARPSLAKYGEPLLRIIQATGCDFFDVQQMKIPKLSLKASDVDVWGCRWDYALVGKAGVVSYSPLEEWRHFASYRMPPIPAVTREAMETADRTRETYPVWASVQQFFQVMQNLRGTENILTDFYTQPEELQKLIDRMLNEYHLPAIEEQLKLKPDLVGLGDDWGTQTSLLISPDLWRQFFKPAYRRMIDLCHQGGAKVWFHSCGHTRAILEEWIELGLDVINPQICCMDAVDYGATACGRIAVLPDLDRQRLLVVGTPDEVRRHVLEVYNSMGSRRGGLIGYAPLEPEIPLANMQAILETISNYEKE